MTAPLRVLHCPEVVGGHPSSLARAEREIGLDSRAVTLHPSPLDYGADEVLTGPGASLLQGEAARFRLLLRALRWADVVHFNFGSTTMPSRWMSAVAEQDSARARRLAARLYTWLLEGRDLRWLRARGIAVAVTFQGSDARPAARTPGWDGSPELTERVDALKRRAVRRIGRGADLIYALNPDLLEDLPGQAEFCPYANLDPRELEPRPPGDGGVPVVVHAPTRRDLKGTPALVAASERLRADGVAHELRLIEGVPNNVAREMLAQADVVVDQLRLGWYGGVAVEAMALAKPVVVHLAEQSLGRIPAAMRTELPLVQSDQASVEGVLRELLTEPRERLAERGLAGRAYAERWHDPLAVARSLAADYERAASARSTQSS